jgi:hypothetical protein
MRLPFFIRQRTIEVLPERRLAAGFFGFGQRVHVVWPPPEFAAGLLRSGGFVCSCSWLSSSTRLFISATALSNLSISVSMLCGRSLIAPRSLKQVRLITVS